MSEQTKKKSVFETLVAIDCSEHTEKKNGLTYLSWAWAWHKVKENYPEAFYTIYENKDGLNYHHDGKTAWVKTGVTIEGLEMIEDLPVMDYRNASIKLDHITSFDVNKAIQRSLTKACARHGLGLYIYEGEDLPDSAKPEEPEQPAAKKPVSAGQKAWAAYRAVHPDLDDETVRAKFAKCVFDMTGKKSSRDVSTEQWEKIIDLIQKGN